MRRSARVVAAAMLAAAVGIAAPAPAPAATSVEVTERVSVATSGTQGNSYSFFPSISGDGRYVAFESFASNLVAGDTNGERDVFVRDRAAGTTRRVSVTSSGGQANDRSIDASISADGRYVAFSSLASNLAAGDSNGSYDVFVHDRQTGATEVVSVDDAGNVGDADSSDPSISGDGRYVAFESRARLVPDKSHQRADIFVHDRLTNQTARVSVDSSGNEGNDWSRSASISADGRFVAFHSWSSNLVPDKTKRKPDVFVHDRDTGQTTRVSVSSSGAEGDDISFDPSISGDGRYVAFESHASNFAAGDTNGVADVFVHDRDTGQTTRVSVSSSGAEGDGSSTAAAISDDGRFVAFDSAASNLVSGDTNGQWDVFVRFSTSPPAVPTLIAPEHEGRFDLGEDQVFTVRSVDPEGDRYRGVIRVVNAATGVTTTFSTATVASGSDASAQPPTPLSPGEYRWSAVAVDEFGATSDRSTEQVFGVVVQPNRTPSVPTLVEPDDGHVFQFGLPERFAVNAVDADADFYRGLVTIANVATGEITEFHTRLVPSGTDSSGRPVAPLAPGNYIWNAVAIDVHGAESDPSETRAFQVVVPSLVLL